MNFVVGQKHLRADESVVNFSALLPWCKCFWHGFFFIIFLIENPTVIEEKPAPKLTKLMVYQNRRFWNWAIIDTMWFVFKLQTVQMTDWTWTAIHWTIIMWNQWSVLKWTSKNKETTSKGFRRKVKLLDLVAKLSLPSVSVILCHRR